MKTLIDNDEIYTVRNRFLDWQLINDAKTSYDRMLTANEQHKLCVKAQARESARVGRLQRNAAIYASHFMQVLLMAVARGEIKRSLLPLYGLSADGTSLPDMKTAEALSQWIPKVVQGEKARIAKGGRPIYNPTISMVATHYDIFREAHSRYVVLLSRSKQALCALQKLRPEADRLILELWNQIEKHFEAEPSESRLEHCRKFGVVYYYRKGEGGDS